MIRKKMKAVNSLLADENLRLENENTSLHEQLESISADKTAADTHRQALEDILALAAPAVNRDRKHTQFHAAQTIASAALSTDVSFVESVRPNDHPYAAD